jgi:hypothetical protein
MKLSDLLWTPIVRRFGARGARWYGRVVFAWLYAMLIFFTARLWIHSQDFASAGTVRGVLFGSIVAVLVVVAASMLTKMRIEYFASIERFVSGQRGH